MPDTKSFFRKFPTAEEKSERSRKYKLYQANANIEKALIGISNEFFTKETSKVLQDPIKCDLVLQRIMSTTPHMEHLSDFVAICFAFTYKNHQSQPQSIGLLRNCIKKDFKFEDQELNLMIYTMTEDPPETYTDIKVCSQIIALICKKSQWCAKYLVERYKEEKYTEKRANFLKAISDEISRDTKNFSQSDLQFLNAELSVDRSIKKVEKETPNDAIFKKAEKNLKAESFLSKLSSYDKIIFIIVTIIALLLIVKIV